MGTLEVKPITMKTTMQRLEQMSQQFRSQAFENYKKEYDIFTGDKKIRLDEVQLRGEERSYVQKMEKLVGGNRVNVDAFTASQKKRMKKVAAASGPPRQQP